MICKKHANVTHLWFAETNFLACVCWLPESYLIAANIPAVIAAALIRGCLKIKHKENNVSANGDIYSTSLPKVSNITTHTINRAQWYRKQSKNNKNTAVKWNSIKSLESSDSIMVRLEFSWRGKTLFLTAGAG